MSSYQRYLHIDHALRAVYGPRGRKAPKAEHFGNVLVEVVSYVEIEPGDLELPELQNDPDLRLLVRRMIESGVGRGRAVHLVGSRPETREALTPQGKWDAKRLRDLGFDDGV